jgi:SAM-dependent methyltransferase
VPTASPDAKFLSSLTPAELARHEKVLGSIRRDGIGLEIGPSFHPFAPKSAGYNVHTLDHLTREQLVEKYKVHGVNVDAIEDVDFVWHGEPFAELTGRKKSYDWIIASHVIEHTPDLIGFLDDCDSVLRDDGVISLAIPDRRYCFDYFRPITGLARIVDAHLARNTIHTAGTAVEYYMNIVSNRDRIAWGYEQQAPVFKFMHTKEDALQSIRSIQEHQAYLDLHAWCFVPHSFRLLMHDLFTLGMSPFKEIAFHPSVGCEFFVTIGRNGTLPAMGRQQLLDLVRSENAQ